MMTSNHSGTRNLILKQRHHFPRILEELHTQRRKTSHWSWYVWPTTKAGQSEPYPKTWVTKPNAEFLLAHTVLEQWIEILDCINDLLSQQNNPSSIIPPIDHGRIRYCCRFWLYDVLDVTRQYPSFKSSLERMSKHFR